MRAGLLAGQLFWKGGDGAIIDGSVRTALAARVIDAAASLRLQTGFIYHYAFAMLLGVAA